jgi:predicted MPP superfamily phosphohydrolase
MPTWSGEGANPRWPTRRQFLRTAAKVAAGAALAAGGYGGFFERSHVVVRKVDVWLARLPEALDGLTIAQLSDLHYHPYFSASVIRRAVELVIDLKPDIVALTGDFVTVPVLRKYFVKAAQDAAPCAELLAPLHPKLGVYAVLGNHDSHADPGLVTEALSDRDIRVLRNEAFPVERNGARIWMAGVGDVLTGFARLESALKPIPDSEAVVLLAHEPDFADEAARHAVDLQLSGHSHGGQVSLPLLGPPMLPELARKYPRGLRKVGRTALYTNVGLGTIIVPIRVLAAPEVTLLTLRAQKEKPSAS